MKFTSTGIATSLAASAALSAGMLAIGASATASGQTISVHSATESAPTVSGGKGSPPTGEATHLLPGDVRVWELTHGYAAEPSTRLPGDVRMWDFAPPSRG